MSRRRHSASLYFGRPNGSSGTINSSDILPAKSVIGDISSNSSLIPSVVNQRNESSCIWIRLGKGRTSLKRAKETRRSPETCTAIQTPFGDCKRTASKNAYRHLYVTSALWGECEPLV